MTPEQLAVHKRLSETLPTTEHSLGPFPKVYKKRAKKVAGVEITADVPPPPKYGQLQKIARALEVGESFEWPQRTKFSIDRIKRHVEGEFVAKRQKNGLYRIWRVA